MSEKLGKNTVNILYTECYICKGNRWFSPALRLPTIYTQQMLTSVIYELAFVFLYTPYFFLTCG